MTDQGRDQVLPPGFAAQLARVIEPGEAEAAGSVLREAAALDEARLAGFLSRVAARVRESPTPITATELRSLLDAQPGAGSLRAWQTSCRRERRRRGPAGGGA